MTVSAAKELADEVNALISIPDIGFKVREMLSDDRSTPKQVARVIERDPALTAALLRVANSALINRGRPVEDINRAITRLGGVQVQELAMGISVSRAFGGLPADQVSVSAFWRHSVFCGAISRLIAWLVNAPGKEQAFTAGLLHDIGELIIYSRRKEMVPELISTAQAFGVNEMTHYMAERSVLAFDHMMVGEHLAMNWSLPQLVRDCVAHHHEPDLDGEMLPVIVHVADLMAISADDESEPPLYVPPMLPGAMEVIGLRDSDIPEILQMVQAGIAEMMTTFNQVRAK